MNKFVDVLGDDISLIKTKENFMDIDDYNKMLKFLDWVSAAQPQNGQHRHHPTSDRLPRLFVRCCPHCCPPSHRTVGYQPRAVARPSSGQSQTRWIHRQRPNPNGWPYSNERPRQSRRTTR